MAVLLKTHYAGFPDGIQIGLDEAGRGPLFGRVYAAAVLLPGPDSDSDFDFSLMKDSKRFLQKKKNLAKDVHKVLPIEQVSDYIKQYSIAWGIGYADETTIDEINILQATQLAMHRALDALRAFDVDCTAENTLLLVDGNYFKPYPLLPRFMTVVKGDSTFASIAAASILAKVARDQYIEALCVEHPYLDERYHIYSNKGYGAKVHMDAIREFGITPWHRKSFAPCNRYVKHEPPDVEEVDI